MGWPQFSLRKSQQDYKQQARNGQSEPMLKLARLHRFFERASANPTSVSCLMADKAGRRDSVELRMDNLDARVRNHSWVTLAAVGVQTVFHTTVKLHTVTTTETHTFMRKKLTWQHKQHSVFHSGRGSTGGQLKLVKLTMLLIKGILNSHQCTQFKILGRWVGVKMLTSSK